MTRRNLEYHPLTLWNLHDDQYFFREEGSGIYSYMFIEDVRNHITPFRTESSRSNKTFEVTISNPSLATEIQTLFRLPLHYRDDSYYHYFLGETIFEFIRECIGLLLVRGGKALFEIVDATFEDENVSKRGFVLKPIHGKVVKFGRTYYQTIPSGIPDMEKKFIAVPQSKVWILKTPKELGKPQDIMALSSNLKELEKASLLGSSIVTSQKELFGFEFSKYHALLDAKLLQVTDKWGWDLRMGINNQHALEYYMFYRMLRFGHSMAVLRTDMLSKMNILVKRLGYDAIMSFSGLPAPADYVEAIRKMEQRKFTFKEASDLIHYSL